MEKKKNVSLLTVSLTVAAVVVCMMAVVLIPVRPVQAEELNKPAIIEPVRKSTMTDMSKHMAGCMKNCQTNMENITAAMAASKAAIEALDKGDTKTAKIEMEKVDKLLATMDKCMKENMQQMPCINGKCPISGKPIDAMNCTKELTRMHKGTKVGFCCPVCPPAWDKLTDIEKDAKLKEVMPPMAPVAPTPVTPVSPVK